MDGLSASCGRLPGSVVVGALVEDDGRVAAGAREIEYRRDCRVHHLARELQRRFLRVKMHLVAGTMWPAVGPKLSLRGF